MPDMPNFPQRQTQAGFGNLPNRPAPGSAAAGFGQRQPQQAPAFQQQPAAAAGQPANGQLLQVFRNYLDKNQESCEYKMKYLCYCS